VSTGVRDVRWALLCVDPIKVREQLVGQRGA
jgi:hypothetical protein